MDYGASILDQTSLLALLSYTVAWGDEEEQQASIKRFPYDPQGRAAENCPERADFSFTTTKPSEGFDILITFTQALISQLIMKGSIALWKSNCRSL